ncbi:hypothetical protein CWI39_0189p0030 [Hamiltosporidium magnivora]|uniref:MAGE domain-containing protein n=1 Tax=Hamiltosporidium magnivora TaxID=148818 RepID=A0A4Q9LJJ5_9MICR|nr:hypothetical protein CWI39_0189p0030 [Hamiltosporidium magnivora]
MSAENILAGNVLRLIIDNHSRDTCTSKKDIKHMFKISTNDLISTLNNVENKLNNICMKLVGIYKDFPTEDLNLAEKFFIVKNISDKFNENLQNNGESNKFTNKNENKIHTEDNNWNQNNSESNKFTNKNENKIHTENNNWNQNNKICDSNNNERNDNINNQYNKDFEILVIILGVLYLEGGRCSYRRMVVVLKDTINFEKFISIFRKKGYLKVYKEDGEVMIEYGWRFHLEFPSFSIDEDMF